MKKTKKEFGAKEFLGLCVLLGSGVTSFVLAVYIILNLFSITWNDIPFLGMGVVINGLMLGIGYVLVKDYIEESK